MKRSYLLIIFIIFLCQNSFAQHPDKSWNATGAGNTYTKLQTATGAKPQVPCGHSGFTDTGHVDEVMDSQLNKHAFRFYMHANEDGNYRQCDPAETKERQRNELAYNTTKPIQKVQYTWYMKLPSDFKTTNNFNYNFCHLHQIKLRDGSYSSQPMFTLSAWRDQLELITSTIDFNGDRVLASEPLANFMGKWVAITEIIKYDGNAASGAYGIQIKELFGAKQELFTFVDNDIQTWKGGATELQVKWGIYRTRTSIGGGTVFIDLQDEEVLYDSFDVKYLNDTNPISFQATEMLLSLTAENGAISSNPTSADGNYEEGKEVTLTATPNEGFEFERWEGDASGSLSPTSITMNEPKSVTAIFSESEIAPSRYLLTLAANNGSISLNPTSADGTYEEGTEVNLSATPNEGFEFERWEGDASGSLSPITITMNGPKSVTAIFTEITTAPSRYLLTLSANNGSISVNPASADGTYEEGTKLTLSATPNEGFEFERWEGDITNTDNPTTFSMNTAKMVIAVFKAKKYLLTIIATDGAVSTNPSSNNSTYGQDTQIRLTAIPDTGFEFEKWEGDINGTENPINILMNDSKTATAIFKQRQHLLTINASDGIVTTDPNSETNTNKYNHDSKVTLVAIPNDSFEFQKWEGDINGTENPVSVTMNTSKTVTAIFETLVVEAATESDFLTFSNPVEETLTIRMREGEEIKMSTVYNSKGQIVLKSKEIELNFSSLSAGLYLLKVENLANEVLLKKVIKR